jgi:hypothetical protein
MLAQGIGNFRKSFGVSLKLFFYISSVKICVRSIGGSAAQGFTIKNGREFFTPKHFPKKIGFNIIHSISIHLN